MVEYWINVVYLALVLAAFTQYRRFVLANVAIIYANYWVSGHFRSIYSLLRLQGAGAGVGRGQNKDPLFPQKRRSANRGSA